LALWRFDIVVSNLLCAEGFRLVPGSHHMDVSTGSTPYATAASPGCGVHCEGARLDGEVGKVKRQARRSTAAKKPLKAARMTSAKLPEQCETMIEVRAGVDQVDRELVALLVRRFGYMDAAARIKTDRNAVRDEARKAEVLGNVARAAEAAGLEPERLRAVWNELVEQSIAYEAVEWDRARADR
jgi:isochorismate pyruvate lyase